MPGRRSRALSVATQYVALGAVAVFAGFPLLWLFLTSIRTHDLTFAMPPVLIFEPFLGHYARVFEATSFAKYFRNSLIAAGESALLAAALGSAGAYAFVRYPFRGNNVLLTFILALRMFPPVTTAVPIFVLVKAVGLYDTPEALVLVYTALNMPLVIWVMKDFFAEVPRELDESARMDGCTEFQAFSLVSLPLASPGLIAAAILSFIFSWNEFMFAMVLTGSNAATTPVLLSGFVTDHQIRWGEMSAVGTLTTAPVIIFALLVKRHLVRGLTLGAVKG